MQSIAIVLLSIAAAVGYVVVHDQVTARVCLEYFTIGDPPIFRTNDPTLLGIGWGVLATWWVGLLLGVPLAVVARAGSRPKRDVGSLVRPVAGLLLVMIVCAAGAGVVGWLLASARVLHLAGSLVSDVPSDRHVPFIADLWAHSASYLVGFVGGIVVLVRVWRSRGRAAAAGKLIGEAGWGPAYE
jgi:hypothetical protein